MDARHGERRAGLIELPVASAAGDAGRRWNFLRSAEIEDERLCRGGKR